jgi:uncharacterized membrane protein YraQ (UPF0718 family)
MLPVSYRVLSAVIYRRTRWLLAALAIGSILEFWVDDMGPIPYLVATPVGGLVVVGLITFAYWCVVTQYPQMASKVDRKDQIVGSRRGMQGHACHP